MPKIKEFEINEKQIINLFAQLNKPLKEKIIRKWLEEMEKDEASDWLKFSELY